MKSCQMCKTALLNFLRKDMFSYLTTMPKRQNSRLHITENTNIRSLESLITNKFKSVFKGPSSDKQNTKLTGRREFYFQSCKGLPPSSSFFFFFYLAVQFSSLVSLISSSGSEVLFIALIAPRPGFILWS